ncbi:MAG: hypothetical protein QF408_07010 [Pirellulales bacterium]|nr:hypothetical protein [Pirellulales bacterium]
MTENPTEQTTPAKNELLDDIERRQDEVLAGLDTLNTQLEQVLKLYSGPEEQTVADETDAQGNGAGQPITGQPITGQPATEESTVSEAAGETIAKDTEVETNAQPIPAEVPAAAPAIEPASEAPVANAGPLMIVPVPEIPVPEIPVPENGAAPSEC